MASYATRFLAAALASGDLQGWMKFGKLDHIFDLDPGAVDAFKFVKGYVYKDGKLPPMEVVEAETGISLPFEDAGLQYLYEKSLETYVQRGLKIAVQDSNAKYGSPLEALQVLADAVSKMRSDMMSPHIADFKEAYSQFWPKQVAKWNAEAVVQWPWPYMAQQSGGIWPGDLMSLVGRPGLGKTWLLLYAALAVWQQTKQPVVFCSMEMKADLIMERLVALYTHTPSDFFKHGMSANMFLKENQKGYKATVTGSLKALESSDMPPFIVVDGNLAATVEDLIALVQQFKPGMVFDDGAYMHKHPKARNIYDAVAINCNLIKSDLCPLAPCLASWQFGRESTKLKKDEKPGLQHIGYSDVIGQASSVVLGLFEIDSTANVEKLYHRVINVLKGRQGETGEFKVNWNHKTMDFTQNLADEKVPFFD